jgi:hypothetical protein
MGREGLALLGVFAATTQACGGGAASGGTTDASLPRDAGGATSDAADDVGSESPDAGPCLAGGAQTDGPSPLPEAGNCQNAWVTSDPACPCTMAGFSQNCAAPGTRCFIPGVGDTSTDEECESEPGGYAAWIEYRLYTPAAFAALPHEIDFDTSDCASRTVLPCGCDPQQPTEGWFSTQVDSLSNCTYGNPVTFFAFTDDGCVSRIRYGNGSPSADFATCLQRALATLRWACATSGTHFVDQDVVLPVGR